MVDQEDLLLRYRVVEELVLLAATGDEQVEFLAREGWDRMELLKGYPNWSQDIVPVLDERGMMSPEVMDATRAVSVALATLDTELANEYKRTKAIKALTDGGIVGDARWQQIRGLAQAALSAFRDLGVTVPDLLDASYNIRRRSAP